MSDDDDSDAGPAPRRGGRKSGVPNYQNTILIRIIERILPNGNEGWRQVALLYKEESGEMNLRSEDDLKKNWVRKLCNNMKKPTGRMRAEAKDRINRCIAIERRILDKTSSGILGGSSDNELNPSSSGSDGEENEGDDEEYKQPDSSEDEEEEEVPGTSSSSSSSSSSEDEEEEEVPGTEVQPSDIARAFSQPPPLPALPPMDATDFDNDNGDTFEANVENNDIENNDIATAHEGNNANRPDDDFSVEVGRATQVARQSAASTSVARARRSTTPVESESGRRSKARKPVKSNKTKNSTNRERSSVTKSIEKIASSLTEGRTDDMQQFLLMRKLEWDEAEERRRQEREEARREREEARREREEMEDRRDRRMERQMQMMMMMFVGSGTMGAGARQFSNVAMMNNENMEEGEGKQDKHD